MPKSQQLTPMLRHYLEVKSAHPDSVLLYRMGDFYELFFEDAVATAPILEVTLTARHKGSENETPMCGVPHHALPSYVSKLIAAGLKVAICDQVEDPKQAKGLVKREVTRVLTPGTVSDPSLLEADVANYLAGIQCNTEGGAGAFLEVSTGKFFVRRWESVEEALDDLSILVPQEIIHSDDSMPTTILEWIAANGICTTPLPAESWPTGREATELLERQLGTATLKGFGLVEGEPAIAASGAALRYSQETQQSELSHIREIQVSERSAGMVLDSVTATNLEIFQNQRDGKSRGSLLWVLDRTLTPGGGRMLMSWMQSPLTDPASIALRLDAVEALTGKRDLCQSLRESLRSFGDPERIVTRAVLGTLSPREAAALRASLQVAPQLAVGVQGLPSGLLQEIAEVDLVSDLSDELYRVIQDEPSPHLKDGNVIREGVNDDLDRYRSLLRDSRKHILEIEARERDVTGISSLKVRFNRVFGYYIEVTKANQGAVPDRYIRKQTLVNSERYITEELKLLEEEILKAEEEQIRLEQYEFERVEKLIGELSSRLRALASAISRLDVLLSLTEVAVTKNYVRPDIQPLGAPFEVEGGRHPVVEQMTADEFVPNDISLGSGDSRIVILTGPNMGGKSTYLRQNALIAIMAQVGSFVPADRAKLGVVDRVFSRVGASDDLSRGESTFMVEMIETARILHQSSRNSFVILDEVGRGTATFDGLSLAWAIVEHLHRTSCPKTLFATHYHELTELAATLDGVVNRTLAVKEWQDTIVFLRRVIPGASDKSYGLHVARLAGIPGSVVERASEILANLEAQEYDLRGRPRLARSADSTFQQSGDKMDQLALFAPAEEFVAGLIREVDLQRLTPLAALNLLHALRDRLDET